jgi:hypothetical protein
MKHEHAAVMARAVVLGTVVLVLTAVAVASVRGAQSEYDAIEAPFAAYMDDWVLASDGVIDYPDASITEAELAALWQDLPNGSECERFAGLALGAVTLAGVYGDTGTTAYLHSGAILYDLLEGAGYACLISI